MTAYQEWRRTVEAAGCKEAFESMQYADRCTPANCAELIGDGVKS